MGLHVYETERLKAFANICFSDGWSYITGTSFWLLCHSTVWMCFCMREFEVEHQWEGTDGSLISKLETKMINTSEHSCLLRDENETNSSVLHIHVSVCLSLRLTEREGLHIFMSRHIWAQVLSEMCLCLCQYRRHPRVLPLAPSLNDHTKSAVFV